MYLFALFCFFLLLVGATAYAIFGLSDQCSKSMNLRSIRAFGIKKSIFNANSTDHLPPEEISVKNLCEKLSQDASNFLRPMTFALNYGEFSDQGKREAESTNRDGEQQELANQRKRKKDFVQAVTFTPSGEKKKKQK